MSLRPARLAALIAATALLAACSGGTSETSTSAAETTAADSADSAAADGAFPVTIEHVYGTTTIPAQPERVATVAWANHEVPLALGIVPVGMSKATWGDDDGDGVLPWVEDKLEELGAETPVLFDETDGIDYEAVADTDPDVILAAYSGITQEEYETLSKIAPTIAYPDVAWGTSWEEMIQLNSAALGLSAEGDALIADLHAQVEAALAAHPEMEDTTYLFSYLDPTDLSQIGFYTSHDTRPGFLESIGLPTPTVVAQASAATDAFYTSVSAEEAEQFSDVDVFITYGDDATQTIATLQSDALLSQIPAIAAGHVAVLQNDTPLAAMANPSPLSIPWGINDYFDILSAPLSE